MKRFAFLALFLLAIPAHAAPTNPPLRVTGGIQTGFCPGGVCTDKSVYVTAYGAKGDGSTDDTTAIANAIAALGSAPNATLVFPSGQYLTTGISVSSVAGLRLRGEGAVIMSSNQTSPVLTLTSCTHCEVSGFTVKHSSVGGGRTTNGDGILILNSTDVKVHDNYVGPVTSIGIRIHGTSDQVTVSSNYVTGTLADGIGTYFGATNVSIVGNHTSNTGDDGISVVAYHTSGAVNVGASIAGNTVYNSASRGIAVVGGDQVTVSGNTVNTTVRGGIHIASESGSSTLGSTNVTVVGNTVSGTGATNDEAGIYVLGTDASYPVTNVNITGNVVNGGAVAMIKATSGVANSLNGVSITNNRLYGPNSAEDGINVVGLNGGTVYGNDIYKAYARGVSIDGTSTSIASGMNRVYFPNQGNAAGVYGTSNASSGFMAPDFVTADGSKTALSGVTTGTSIGTLTFAAPITFNGTSTFGASPTFSAQAIFTSSLRLHRTTVADAIYTVSTSQDYEIAYTSLTATRVITINCATGLGSSAPLMFVFKDESGNASGTIKLTLTPSAGTIDGSASKDIITSAYGSARVYSNGTNCFTW